MSDEEMDTPIMDGSNDATDEEKLSGLAEQVEQDYAGEEDAAKAAHLRDRVAETFPDDDEADDAKS